jgi:hypothetical protein
MAHKRWLFDSKLWRVFRSETLCSKLERTLYSQCNLLQDAKRYSRPLLATAVSVKSCQEGSAGKNVHTRRMSSTSALWEWQERLPYLSVLKGLLGFVYVAASLTGSVTFLTVAQVNMSNDFWWVTFNSSGTHAYVANTINNKLLAPTQGTAMPISHPEYASIRPYNGTSTIVSFGNFYASNVVVEELSKLSVAVQGLRQMSPCNAPWMFTQYCWLDFGQQWPMANTALRQERCLKRKDNGALYLEAVLRNFNDWAAWDRCWGQTFETGIAAELKKTATGMAWLQKVR